MRLNVKDVAATGLTCLAVLVFTAGIQGWNVALVGDSRRWAAGAIFLLGAVTCALGRPAERGGPATRVLGGLGVLTLCLAAASLITGSTVAVALLTAAVVLLWIGATVRHALPHGTVTAGQ